METKILKVKIQGSIAAGNREPVLANHLPLGVNLKVIEYGTDYAIVKLFWTKHALIEKKPKAKEIAELLSHPSIIEETTHPDADKHKHIKAIAAFKVKEKPDKKLEKDGKTDSYIRKEKIRDLDIYVVDEG